MLRLLLRFPCAADSKAKILRRSLHLSTRPRCRVASEQSQHVDEADAARAEAERRSKLQQHLSTALSTAILPCPPMVLRSAASLAAQDMPGPAEDAPEDAAYWDLVIATLPMVLQCHSSPCETGRDA